MHRKVFLAFFVLLLGCQPVVLTAETAVAVDSSVPHLAVAAECNDDIKDKGYPRFARLMHDWQWMDWPSRMQDPEWNTGFHLDWYPAPVQLWLRPKGGDGSVPYNRAWLEYLRDLQPNDSAAVWITTIAAGLFNLGNDPINILDLDQMERQPIAEGISSAGNVVKVLQVRNGSARVEMLYYRNTPPDPGAINYQKTPWLVTKFTSVSIDGELGNAGGIDVYFPLLAKQKNGYWVEMDRVEWFPRLPVCVVAEGVLNVRSGPGWGASVIGQLPADQVVLVTDYMPQGSDVFGKTPLGWIVLEYLKDGQPIYPTSWDMDTRPPILFR